MSGLAKLQVQDTEKQRHHRWDDDTRLTESRDVSSEQLLVMPTKSLTN